MTLHTRLARLDRVLSRNSERDAPEFDYSQLTAEEQYELYVLLDTSPLTDAELERLNKLFERITEAT